MTSRSEATNALLKLTPQQVTDLCEFERFKKWTAELFALQRDVNYSTSHRRLHKLLDAGALAVREGRPLPAGGRETDIYYPTSLGARMITRLRDRGKHYVTAPDVSNPIDNVHDLAALEVAIRSGCYATARAFQERTFQGHGKTISLIPDVEFVSPDRKDRVFVEVEQTSRPEHIAGKYEKYTSYFEIIGPASAWLLVVFPDERAERLLRREHETAAESAAAECGKSFNFFWATLSEVRSKNVRTYEGVMRQDPDQTWHQVADGLLDCAHGMFYW
jgi:hypothetical protein